ncbi:MAG TPA: amidohydrolase family protein, partial [Pyrinomonadaceae bacterium]|nr:amidohydrolase family protein [Pyrinomonadaceae bacterium]
MRLSLLLLLCLAVFLPARQTPTVQASYLLKPARVFDGESERLHENWAILVRGDKIVEAGPAGTVTTDKSTKVIELVGLTLMPGLIEAHSHVLLHPYTETVWNEQVAKESLSLRVARATNHLRDTLQAGFTTIRDLGTEGAGYADVGLKQAIEQNIIPGPRM